MSVFALLEGAWAHVSATYKPGTIEFTGVVCGQVVGFIIPATVYLTIDILFPKFSQRHKIQGARRQPKPHQIRHCVIVSLSNHAWLAGLHFLTHYMTNFNHSFFEMSLTVPSLKTFVGDFIFGLLAREALFYYVHRALHHPSIYVYIHKMHHRYITPIAFSAEYAHPVEHLIANVLPITLPLLLKGTHFLSFLAFSTFELWEAAADHSGYDFLKLPPAELHDLHHEKFRVNYGTIGLMDWIHGTNMVGSP